MSTNALRCAILTTLMATRVLGKPVRNAASSGRRKSTKCMRNIHSMCRDIERWAGNGVQIPGNKIEPQCPFLDTLMWWPVIRDSRRWSRAKSEKAVDADSKVKVGEARWRKKDHLSLG